MNFDLIKLFFTKKALKAGSLEFPPSRHEFVHGRNLLLSSFLLSLFHTVFTEMILFHDKRLLTLEMISVDTVDSQAGQLLKTAYKMYSTCWVFFLQVKAFSSTSFLTSSVDSGLSLWKDDGLRLKSVKGDHSVSHDRNLQTDSIVSSVTKLLTLEHFLPFKTVYILSQFLSPPRCKKIKPKKLSSNGNKTHGLCDTGAVLY